jgi:hypothetical protein
MFQQRTPIISISATPLLPFLCGGLRKIPRSDNRAARHFYQGDEKEVEKEEKVVACPRDVEKNTAFPLLPLLGHLTAKTVKKSVNFF